MRIKRGDMVVVIAGDDKGSTPRLVEQVIDGGRKVVVEGVNIVHRHVRRGHPKSPQGGRLRMEKPIQSSNVLFYCSQCSKGVKLGLRFTPSGAKERYCKKCSRTVGQVSPARPAHAQH